MLDERRLHCVEIAVPLQPFYRGDASAVLHRGQGHAGKNAAALDMDGTCSAFAAIAPLLRPGQVEFITQGIKQCRARLDRHAPNPAVDRHADGHARVVVRHRVLAPSRGTVAVGFVVALSPAALRTSSLCGAHADTLATSCFNR